MSVPFAVRQAVPFSVTRAQARSGQSLHEATPGAGRKDPVVSAGGGGAFWKVPGGAVVTAGPVRARRWRCRRTQGPKPTAGPGTGPKALTRTGTSPPRSVSVTSPPAKVRPGLALCAEGRRPSALSRGPLGKQRCELGFVLAGGARVMFKDRKLRGRGQCVLGVPCLAFDLILKWL